MMNALTTMPSVGSISHNLFLFLFLWLVGQGMRVCSMHMQNELCIALPLMSLTPEMSKPQVSVALLVPRSVTPNRK